MHTQKSGLSKSVKSKMISAAFGAADLLSAAAEHTSGARGRALEYIKKSWHYLVVKPKSYRTFGCLVWRSERG